MNKNVVTATPHILHKTKFQVKYSANMKKTNAWNSSEDNVDYIQDMLVEFHIKITLI